MNRKPAFLRFVNNKNIWFALPLVVLGTACERHPASQTVHGYEHKQAVHQEVSGEKKMLPAEHELKFFHTEKSN